MYIGKLDFENTFDRDSKHFIEMLWRSGYSVKEKDDEIYVFEVYEGEELNEDSRRL